MLKELNYYDVVCGRIKVKEDDLQILKKHIKKEIPLFYDEYFRVFNEAGVYVADIESIEEDIY